jgi:hypothetical protein
VPMKIMRPVVRRVRFFFNDASALRPGY